MGHFTIDNGKFGANAIALEDSIMQKGKNTTAGSRMLENFCPLFNATVVDRLITNGKEIAGKTVMDEFGIGNIFSDETDPILEAVDGVSNDTVAYVLCNDILGKYRQQAAENDCCYIHPTYGTVSRFGLIPLVSSMDQIGVVCKNPIDGFELLSLIAGKDENDGAMFPEEKYKYKSVKKKLTIGIPDAVISMAGEKTQKGIRCFAWNFNSASINLEYFNSYKQIMYILSSAEISHNINRYDGIKYGYRTPQSRGLNDLYTKSRTEGFERDVKFTAIMGAMMLSQENYTLYYEKAMQIRRLIKESLRFDGYDAIVLPCRISNSPYENLSLYALANLAGLPSISFSYKGEAIQLIANTRNESTLLTAWEVCMA